MNKAEIVVGIIAVFLLVLGWKRGYAGHRSCRLIHMKLSGRTTDVAFQPTGWHPKDTKGHPRNPETDELLQLTCKRTLFWTKVFVTLMTAIVALGAWKARTATAVGLGAAEVGVAAVYAYYFRWRLHRIKITRPMASPLSSVLSYHLRLGASDISDGMLVADDGVVERIEVPSTFLSFDRNQDEVDAILKERLPLQTAEWHLEATFPYIDLPFKLHLPRPRDVRFRDLIAAMDACRGGEYVAGLDTEGPYELSFRKHPHHAWSFATGRGKSTLLRAVVVQLLAQDTQSRVVCVDTKRVSLEPIRSIPRLTYLNNPNDIGSMVGAINAVKAETDRRYEERERTGRRQFPFFLLVLEEAADLDDAVRQWWQQRRNRDRSLPQVPPVWTDSFSSILRQGREVNVHVLIVTQDFDDRRYGGVGVRMNFELIAMSGWRPQQWTKCIGTTPVPRPEAGPGRMVVCYGNVQHPVQGMDATQADLLAYARGERPALVPGTGDEADDLDGDGVTTTVEDPPA